MRDIMPNYFEIWLFKQMVNITSLPGIKIIKALYFQSTFDQAIAQVRPQKSCSASDKNSFH